MELDFKKKIIIGAFIALVLGISGYLYFDYINNSEVSSVEPQISEKSEVQNSLVENTEDKDEKEENIIIVHISGCVLNPGIVKIKEGARLYEVIESAGGNTQDADLDKINLAIQISDGQKIHIPKIGEVENYQSVSSDYITGGTEHTDFGANLEGDMKKVNINTATQSELETLPGVGPATAQKIIDYRTKNGKFEIIDDIQNVSGIGDVKYDDIRDHICI